MKKKNLVLIGMPGSGKTKISEALSALLDVPAVDTDDLVEQAAGRSIPDIFAGSGEAAFRDMETAAAKKAAGMDGVIIATGGGIVLRAENMEALSATGVVFFRDREVAAILGEDHSGRPLIGSHSERIWTLYRQRLPLYQRYADHIVSHTDTVEEAAAIIAELYIRECGQ